MMEVDDVISINIVSLVNIFRHHIGENECQLFFKVFYVNLLVYHIMASSWDTKQTFWLRARGYQELSSMRG